MAQWPTATRKRAVRAYPRPLPGGFQDRRRLPGRGRPTARPRPPGIPKPALPVPGKAAPEPWVSPRPLPPARVPPAAASLGRLASRNASGLIGPGIGAVGRAFPALRAAEAAWRAGQFLFDEPAEEPELDASWRPVGSPCAYPKGPINYASWAGSSLDSAETWGNYCAGCLSGQGAAGPGTGNRKGPLGAEGLAVAAGRQGLVLSHQYVIYPSGYFRYQYQRAYWRGSSAPATTIRIRNYARVRPYYQWPSVNPFPEVGPAPRARTLPDPTLRTEPGTEITITDRGISTRPGAPGRPKPPGNDTLAERKFVLSLSNGSAIGRIVGAAGELGDFVEAIYSTLPRRFKSRDADTLQERIAIIARNLDQVDWAEALGNMIVNEVQDRAIGRIGQHVARINRRLGRPAGLTLGPAL